MSKKNICYYGKLPSYGDFISQNMPLAFTDVWDTWLRDNLVYWEKVFSEAFFLDYMRMKTYRFILSSGIAGEVIWCGVILPSRDQSGRLFPFTLCIPLSAKDSNPLELFKTHHEWLNQLESQAIKCLMPDFTKEKFQGEFQKTLENLATQCPDSIDQSNKFTCMAETETIEQATFAWHTSTLNKHSMDPLSNNIYPQVLDKLLKEYCYAYSLWWTAEDEDFMLCQGLPSTELSPALIDGNWSQWNWLTNPVEANNTSTNGPTWE